LPQQLRVERVDRRARETDLVDGAVRALFDHVEILS
jgi:hypothetical protein